jgi:hypothetical protein
MADLRSMIEGGLIAVVGLCAGWILGDYVPPVSPPVGIESS